MDSIFISSEKSLLDLFNNALICVLDLIGYVTLDIYIYLYMYGIKIIKILIQQLKYSQLVPISTIW